MKKSSILKNVALLFLIVVLILSASILTGCGSGTSFYIGDYLETDYFKYYTSVGAGRREYVCIRGLTDKGKELEYVVFPESIDGIPVTKIAIHTSDSKAKKAYISTSIISLHVPYWTTVSKEPVKLIDQRFTYSLENSINTPWTYVSEYAEKVLVEKFNNFYLIANLCYLYNYEDSPNGGQWFVDDLDEGERIGYILVSPECKNCGELYAAVCGAGRALGFVCAPSLLQYTVRDCVDVKPDLDTYKTNRDIFYGALTSYGYTVVPPDGAFYLFVKSPEPDAYAFCERAKKYELLLVPGDDFGCKGYVRICYCVSREQIENSLSAFKALIEEYNK